MSTKEYWVNIYQQERWRGAGFLFPPCYAVTASHCLDPADARVDISLASGEILRGRVHRRSAEADLALIDIPGSGRMISTPMFSRAKRRDEWRSPYRPTLRDRELAGKVTSASMRYKCDGGAIIEALQLSCAQSVDTYSGYSGSPIERDGPDDSRAVFGVLLEEFLDSRSDPRLSNGASGDLIAATVSEIYRQFFECFGAGVLLNPLASPLTETSTMPSPARMAVDARDAATDYNTATKFTNSGSMSTEPQLQILRGMVTDAVLVPVLVQTVLGALQDILNGQIEGEA
jgi:hypothetical protein